MQLNTLKAHGVAVNEGGLQRPAVREVNTTLQSNPEGVLVLYPRRWKWVLLLLVCWAFVAIGGAMAADGKKDGWAVMAIFGVGAGIGLLQVISGCGWLKLTPEGFEYCVLFRRHRTAWKDVKGFSVVVFHNHGLPTNKRVAFDYVSGYPRQGFLRGTARALAGVEAALPDSYGKMSAAELAGLMEQWRRRYAVGGGVKVVGVER